MSKYDDALFGLRVPDLAKQDAGHAIIAHALVEQMLGHAGPIDKTEDLASGTETKFFVAKSRTEIQIKKGVQSRIERTPTETKLILTLPGATGGDSMGQTLVCRCGKGKSGTCNVSSTTHVAICGGDDCCGWRSPEITTPQRPDVPPPP